MLRDGTDVTVVSWGPPVREALKAAETLAAEGVSAEVVDLRTLYPWDRETVLDSVDRTGRLVVAHEAHTTSGFGAEILAAVSEHGLYSLEAPPVRVAHMDVFWGPTQLERYSMITADRIHRRHPPRPGRLTWRRSSSSLPWVTPWSRVRSWNGWSPSATPSISTRPSARSRPTSRWWR